MAYFPVQSSRSVSTVDNSIPLIECSLVIVLVSGSAPCLSPNSGKGAMVGPFDVVRRGPKALDNLSLHFNVVRIILSSPVARLAESGSNILVKFVFPCICRLL